LVEDGDTIIIDADLGTIDLMVDDAILAERKAKWQPRENDFASGTLWKYAQTVGPAFKGAVTHPGGAKEKKQYADI
jgi:dihydroxy-acid dehydratase